MSSFEWMELQTLTSEITSSRSRLAAARAGKDHRLARMLEQEITAAEDRRARLLAHITNHLASEHAEIPGVGKDTDPDEAPAAAEETPPAPGNGAWPPPEFGDRMGRREAASPAAAATADSAKGGTIVWDQLTPSDIERAKSELGDRRAEMLARHAEELKRLDADETELQTLEQAIGAFLQKFKQPALDGAVVQLGEERELRLQGRA